jgi:hypothetical protein
MNLFVLSDCPFEAAKSHCDIHVNKMIIETAQMLSTAHRLLDGKMFIELSKSGSKLKKWDHPKLHDVLYKSTHYNHPSSVWIRAASNNYRWAYCLFKSLCNEYTDRRGKVHATQKLLDRHLFTTPANINAGMQTPFAICIADEYDLADVKDPIEAYRRYYIKKNNEQFNMTWIKNKPSWFTSSEYGEII